MSATAPTQSTVVFDVLAGPSAGEIIDGLKYAFRKNASGKLTPMYIGFRLSRRADEHRWGSDEPFVIDAQIKGVRYESGVEGSFELDMNISGYSKAKGYYHANRRKGVFRLTENIKR